MTAYTQQDYQRTGQQDAGQVTASKDDLDREYNDRAERGNKDVARDAADGHSAGAREARHMERSGPAPDREQETPAEQRWHAGYRSGGYSAEGLLRELEKEAG